VPAVSDDIRALRPRGEIDPVHHYFIELTKLVLSKTDHLYPKKRLVFIKKMIELPKAEAYFY